MDKVSPHERELPSSLLASPNGELLASHKGVGRAIGGAGRGRGGLSERNACYVRTGQLKLGVFRTDRPSVSVELR